MQDRARLTRAVLRLMAMLGATVALAGSALLSGATAYAASGGVSDGQLATAIVLPIIFVGAFLAVMAWAVAGRETGDQDAEKKPMAWWRTEAWYSRRESSDE